MKTSNRDWSFPSCSKCYQKYLHDNSPNDPGGCEGKINVCVHYCPPLNAETQEASRRAFSKAVEALE